MKITSKGFTLETLEEYLSKWTERLKGVFGNDYVIKKEGIVSNVATASSLSSMDLESQLAYLLKQLDPYTAEGEWQDKLYSIIGLKRRQATYTVVSRTCSGTPNTQIEKGELVIENAATKDQFRNNDTIQFNSSGIGLGSFTAEESGAIELPSDASINIITPFANLIGVYYEPSNLSMIGDEYESDDQFRERWLLTSSLASANTDDGLYKALLDLVETRSDLKIFDNRTGSVKDGIDPHSLRIVLNSAYDDETIASIIMDHLVDGNMFGLQGKISVDVADSEGTKETIRFDRADVQSIYLSVRVGIVNNISLATSQTEIKNNILSFVTNNKFDMGSKIWANMFAASVYSVSSVTEITELKISTDGQDWKDFVQLNETEVPSFDFARIQVYEDA